IVRQHQVAIREETLAQETVQRQELRLLAGSQRNQVAHVAVQSEHGEGLRVVFLGEFAGPCGQCVEAGHISYEGDWIGGRRRCRVWKADRRCCPRPPWRGRKWPLLP